MDTIQIEVDRRERLGKSAVKAARRDGRLPAVLYGPKRTAVAVAVDAHDFGLRVASNEGNPLLELRSSDPDIAGRLALVKDLQRHPVTDVVLHADLYEVEKGTKIRVDVPLHFVGEAAGVEVGGILQPNLREVEVECLPSQIPEYIEVDVAPLNINDTLHLSDLRLPAGAELIYETDDALVSVLPPTVEEAPVAEEGEEEAGAAPEEESSTDEPGSEE